MAATLNDLLGLGAGVLVLGVGLFVLVARPASALHRLFFLLAVADGGSTILFGLSYAVEDPALATYFRATYWYFFLLFIALLGAFAVLFPHGLRLRGATSVLLAAIGLVFLVATWSYARDHSLFWNATLVDGRAVYSIEPWGNVAQILFAGATAAIGARMTLLVVREPSPSHRRQAAFVLGGMTLAYAPYAATVTAQALLQPRLAFFESRPDRVAAYWALALFCAGLVASAILLWRDRHPEGVKERRFVLACYGGVLALAIAAAAFPTPAIGALLRSAALLAYPMLLGYAIARYEVFDIDRRLRRASSVTLAAVGLSVAFVLVENAAENLLQQRVFAGVPSSFASGSAAAIVTAFAFVPIARYSRRAASKLVPELSHDELYDRKIEIYRHSLAGALADGILREGESRTLAALRSSLGISDHEHQRLLAEVAT